MHTIVVAHMLCFSSIPNYTGTRAAEDGFKTRNSCTALEPLALHVTCVYLLMCVYSLLSYMSSKWHGREKQFSVVSILAQLTILVIITGTSTKPFIFVQFIAGAAYLVIFLWISRGSINCNFSIREASRRVISKLRWTTLDPHRVDVVGFSALV